MFRVPGSQRRGDDEGDGRTRRPLTRESFTSSTTLLRRSARCRRPRPTSTAGTASALVSRATQRISPNTLSRRRRKCTRSYRCVWQSGTGAKTESRSVARADDDEALRAPRQAGVAAVRRAAAAPQRVPRAVHGQAVHVLGCTARRWISSRDARCGDASTGRCC
jgi:hypothetical protein